MIGSSVAHYLVTDKLGQGGMGTIYKARDTRLNRFVALKILPPDKVSDPERRRRFIQEAQASSSLNHPNIVVLYDIVETDDTICLVLEHIEGKNLGEIVPRNGLETDQALLVATQVAAGLAAAHEAGIVHRDLKPANIMVTDSGLVKILDFGLAKLTPAFTGELAAETATKFTLTTDGAILGTVNYMSPEQAEGRPVDARSDIFSFGVVLYEMLTGVKAFQASTILSTLTQVLRDDPRPINEIKTAAPPEVERLVELCLRKNPADRIQTMREVYTTLAQLRTAHETLSRASGTLPRLMEEPPTVIVAPTAAQSHRIPRTLWWIFALLAIPLLALGVYLGTLLPSRGAAARPAPDLPPTNAQTPVSPPPAAPVVLRPAPPGAPAEQQAPAAPVPTAPPPPKETPAAAKPAPKESVIRDATPVRLVLMNAIPDRIERGSQVALQVAAPVLVSGTVLIAKGAPVTATVAEVGKSLITRRPKVMLRLNNVKAINGRDIPLRAVPVVKEPRDASRPLDAVGDRASAAEPVSGVAAAAGSEYWGYVHGDARILIEPH
ncbi:MAG: serine/threonine protein kinase [Bryobacterales bacterium]|nr:serine/threonine protein kinase [Bryobacterales bacterium]